VIVAAGRCADWDREEWERIYVPCVDSWALYLDPPLSPRVYYEENPALGVSTTTLDFGTATDELTLTLENTGDGVLDWIAPPPESLTVSPDFGETAAGESSTLTVTVDRAALGAGDHVLELPVRSDGGDEVVSVTVSVQ